MALDDFSDLRDMYQEEYDEKQRPGKAWYLLPVFLGILGGLVGWFLLKDKYPGIGLKLLITGTVVTVVAVVLYAFLPFDAILGAVNALSRGEISIDVGTIEDLGSIGDVGSIDISNVSDIGSIDISLPDEPLECISADLAVDGCSYDDYSQTIDLFVDNRGGTDLVLKSVVLVYSDNSTDERVLGYDLKVDSMDLLLIEDVSDGVVSAEITTQCESVVGSISCR